MLVISRLTLQSRAREAISTLVLGERCIASPEGMAILMHIKQLIILEMLPINIMVSELKGIVKQSLPKTICHGNRKN
jgi:hypothetical protein